MCPIRFSHEWKCQLAREFSVWVLTQEVELLLKDETQAVKAAKPMRDRTIKGALDPFRRISASILKDLQALPIHFQRRPIP